MKTSATRYTDKWAVQMVRLGDPKHPVDVTLAPNPQAAERARRAFLGRLDRAGALGEFGVEVYNPGDLVPDVDLEAETLEEWCTNNGPYAEAIGKSKAQDNVSTRKLRDSVEEPTYLVVSDVNDKVVYCGHKDQAITLMRTLGECGGQATLFRRTTVEDEEP